MNERLEEKVSVITVYNSTKGTVFPWKLKWHDRLYAIDIIGYHYKVTKGAILYHFYTVSSGSTAFKLRLDTSNLHWTLEELYDATADQS